ncbi:MAG TPA: beta-propeller fold lactonase family protein, partial [Gemmatimonadaceae bacterium]|nr:beta-propeller fold lactonase family protein [Gemmatimonadaceae bacterium]
MTDSRNPSRREFLAASAIGLIGLARGKESYRLHDDEQTDGDLLYVGTYTDGARTDGIYLIRIDRRSGELRKVGSLDAGPNPSFLSIHPNRRVLYAVNELEEYKGKATGAVTAFAIARNTGALTRLNQQPSEGGAPCYVSVDRNGEFVLVANYVGGN